MRTPLNILALLLISILLLPAAAQKKLLRFDRLDVNNGLSHNIVRSIAQDSLGFIWIGTNNGLNRYDGYEFRKYFASRGDSISLKNNYIAEILASSDGVTLWLGTINGLCRYDQRDGRIYPYPGRGQRLNDDLDKHISVIFEDDDRNLWIGTAGSGLYFLDIENNRLTHFQHSESDVNSINADNIRDIVRDPRAPELILWVATNSGITRVVPSRNEFRRYSIASGPTRKQDVFCLYFDAENSLWAGTTGDALYKYDPASDRLVYQFNVGSNLLKISGDHENRLWLGTNRGILVYDPQTKKYQQHRSRFYDPSSISHDAVREICKGTNGTMWVGTHRGINLAISHKYKFKNYAFNPLNKNSIPSAEIGPAIPDPRFPDDIMWIGTTKGVVKFDLTNGIFEGHLVDDEPNTSNYVRDLHMDYKGVLWLATSQGLLAYDPKRKRIIASYQYDPQNAVSLSHNKIRSISVDQERGTEILWLATDVGISRLNTVTGNSESFLFSQLKPDVSEHVFFIETNPNKKDPFLWIGLSEGLFRFDKNTHQILNPFERYLPESLRDIRVFDICFTRDGKKLWLATSGQGLFSIDLSDSSIMSLTRDQGIPSNLVYALVEDTQGNIWFSSEGGIAKIDVISGEISTFGVDNGLDFISFKPFARGATNSGIILFGAINGLCAFDPNDITRSLFEPPVHITKLYINQKPVFYQPGSPLALNYDHKNLFFEFCVLDFTSPTNNRYKYRMSGLEEEWIESGRSRTALYAGLEPGSYKFQVKGSNSDGVWNENITSVDIYIKPPFWQTWWFRGIVVLISIVFLMSAYFWRIYSYRQREKELAQMVAERTKTIESLHEELVEKEKLATLGQLTAIVSHELRNPLGTISSTYFTLREEIGEMGSPRSKQALKLAERNIRRIDLIIQEMLDFTKRKTVLLLEMDIDDWIRKAVREIEIPDDIALELILESGSGVKMDVEQFRRAFQNILVNAIQALQDSPQQRKEIRVETRTLDDNIEIIIRDNGPGIDEQNLSRVFEPLYSTKSFGIGLGLPIVKDVMNVHHGGIRIHSSPGKGTDVILWLPLENKDRQH